jgi:nitroreductase
MNVVECISTRRSVRSYTDENVSRELITEVVDLAKMAPTWKNSQTIRYVAVDDEELIKKIATEATLGFEHNRSIIEKCKCLMVLAQVNGRCGYEKDGSFTTSKGTGWEMFDAGIAAQTFCLLAWEKGLGTCILGIFDDAKVAEIIGLPEGQTVAALIPVGVPATNPDATPRKATEDILTFK